MITQFIEREVFDGNWYSYCKECGVVNLFIPREAIISMELRAMFRYINSELHFFKGPDYIPKGGLRVNSYEIK